MYQIGILDHFCEGHFEGITTAKEMLKHGDFGIGTFEGGDGEMILLDGALYHAGEYGDIEICGEDALIPFANVGYFSENIPVPEIHETDKSSLETILENIIAENGRDNFYFLKLHGTFSRILARSEKGQKPPYVNIETFLSYAQREFEFINTTGIMAAIFVPEKYKNINSVGWHYHYIDDSFTVGGHVLEFTVLEASGYMDDYVYSLPIS